MKYVIDTLDKALMYAHLHGLFIPSATQQANGAYIQCWIDRVASVERAHARFLNQDTGLNSRLHREAIDEANRYAGAR